MGIPPILNVCRHDTDNRALVTLTGEIDLQSAPLVHTPAERYPHDGIHTIDADVTAVTSCDYSGINAFLHALQHSATTGGSPATAPVQNGVGTPRHRHRLGLRHPRPSKCLRREPTALAALSRAPGHAPARPGACCSPGRCAATALAGPIRSRGRPDHQPFTTRTTPLSQGRLTSSGRAFAFAGILVRPHARGRDEARRLQERPLTEHRAPLGVTLADRPDQPILAALRCWDRTDVGDGRRAADGAVLLTLVLPLGVRTAARPEGLDHRSWTRWSP